MRKAVLLLSSFSIVIVVSIALFGSSAYAQTSCPPYTFSNNNRYANCNPLPVLDSFLYWSYHLSNNTVDIAHRHTGLTASSWVAWCLNPSGARMIGSQCLVAFVNSTGLPHPFTSAITGYNTRLQEGPLSFRVPRIAAEFRNSTEMIIYATIELPHGRTNFTHIWQHGLVSSSGAFQAHPMTPQHLRPFANIDFATGTTASSSGGGGSKQRLRNVHGIINVVSWGMMMPLGAMIARYVRVLKPPNPVWFYLHVTCQCLAYLLGVAGWATGLHLGSRSPGVLSLRLRPKPDHKYRIYWNVYHHSIGYSVITLSIVNIFKGFDILDPEKKWKRAYVSFLIALGAVAVCLEVFTCFVVTKRKRQTSKQPLTANGVNGA
ncbi:cytochrome b561 and DOMON domain-containing protein at5g47530 [Phtheirospermum japonicum]|uniref:Cytochrome b561 and DOMON domain-containing protein at5g47530 n=1 Tax=Phtheirospermum japonicum TaxID=374723 RepID=A0A830BBY5_9LAMI|nr:cytochrome b561 and DOMON domain-containing protein at5g47530 [Phtheirospermum japonicum]